MSSYEYSFWQKVNQSGDCWEWTASKNRFGYGQVSNGKKLAKAHRVAYEFDNGPIPAGLDIDHICRNRGCVKPAHLRAVTAKQNGENLSDAFTGNITSGVRGVYRTRNGRWQARVTHYGKVHTAGTHDTIEQAGAAVIDLRNKLFTHNDADRQQRAS